MAFFGIFGKSDKDSDDTNTVIVDVDRIRNTIEETYPHLSTNELENIVDTIKSEIKDYYENTAEKQEMDIEDVPFNLTSSIANYMIANTEDRLNICNEIDLLISNYPEALQTIRIYASTIAYGSPEFKLDEYKVILTKSNQDVSDDVLDGAKKFIDNFNRKSNIKRLLYLTCKDLVKYGDAFLEILRDDNGNIKAFGYIPSNTVYIVSDEFGNPVKYYQILDLSINYRDIIKRKRSNNKVIEFNKNEILHFNDGSLIGAADSPFKSLIPIWRAYTLLEQSLVIHRVTRSKRYVVFFVDVTGKDKKQVRQSIRAFINKLNSFFTFDVKQGVRYSYSSTIKTGEDIVIPVTKQSATKMQIIPADTGAHKIDDLNFFHKRLLNILFVDHLFGDKKNKNPDIDKAFNRLIRVYQRQISWILEDMYRKVLEENNYKDIDVGIIFPTPDSDEETKLVDTLVRRLLLINQLTTVLGKSLPFQWVIEYVFKDLTMSQLEELKDLLLEAEEQPTEENEYVENLMTYQPIGGNNNENTNQSVGGLTNQNNNQSGGSIIDKLSEQGAIPSEQLKSIFEKYNDTTDNYSNIADINKVIELTINYLSTKNHSVNNKEM